MGERRDLLIDEAAHCRAQRVVFGCVKRTGQISSVGATLSLKARMPWKSAVNLRQHAILSSR
jgi:hypothetical protein